MRAGEAQNLADAATSRHRDGDLDEAERLYRQALSLDPALPDGLHGLGLLALGRGLPAQAIALIGRAVAARPEIALYTLNLGLALHAKGHLEEARAALHVAALRDPIDARAHAGLAAVLDQLGRHDEAVAAARTALDRAPPGATPPGMSALLGRSALRDGDWQDAVRRLSDAVGEAPSDAGAWHGLAVAHAALGHAAGAERCFRQVAELLPDDAAALANLGARLFENNRLDEALVLLRRSVGRGAPTAETLSNLGLVLLALGHLREAERALADSARKAPDQPGIAVNHGTALLELGRTEEAERIFADVETRFAGTIDAARARFDRATLLLAAGRFREGWQAFEARRTVLGGPAASLPDWNGGPLASGRLLIEAEQGLGDIIQFLRFVTLAMRRAQVSLAVPQALIRIARQALPADCVVITKGEPASGCIARAGLLSLPLLLGLDRPLWTGPYLHAATDGVMPGPADGAIGVCWAGSPDYRFDRRRSLSLAQLAPLSRCGRTFVALQQGDAADQPTPPGLRLARPRLPPDLADTAALIATLDLVITVDTAIAHLAGALGRPVWLLNRFGGDWRWQDGNLAADGTSLWYPSLRVFRQPAPLPPELAWEATIANVADALLDFSRFDNGLS